MEYEQSERRKQLKKEWEQSDKGKEYRKKYQQSETRKNYEKSEKVKERKKNYEKSEKRKEAKKKWREENKEKINEVKSKGTDCVCGGHYTERHKAVHFKTKKHQDWEEKKKTSSSNIKDSQNE